MYLLQLVFQPLQELSDVYGQMQSAAAAMVKISAVLDAEPDIARPPGRARRCRRIEGSIELDQVRFAYGDNEVLHGDPGCACRPAAASRWSASRAAASRRWPS